MHSAGFPQGKSLSGSSQSQLDKWKWRCRYLETVRPALQKAQINTIHRVPWMLQYILKCWLLSVQFPKSQLFFFVYLFLCFFVTPQLSSWVSAFQESLYLKLLEGNCILKHLNQLFLLNEHIGCKQHSYNKGLAFLLRQRGGPAGVLKNCQSFSVSSLPLPPPDI